MSAQRFRGACMGGAHADVHVLAIDLAKRSFQVCGTDRGGAVLFNRTVSCAKLIQLLTAQSPCIVAMILPRFGGHPC